MKSFFSVSVLSLLLGLLGMNTAALAATHETHHHQRSSAAILQKVDLNTADVMQLQNLKGIGPKKADAIIAYRKQHGRFKSLKDLSGVKGIGEKWIANLVKKNPDRVVVK